MHYFYVQGAVFQSDGCHRNGIRLMALHVAQSIPLKLHGMVLHRLLQAGPLINRSKRLVKKPAAKRSVAEDVPKGVVPAQLNKQQRVEQRRTQLAAVGSLVQASVGPACRARYAECWQRVLSNAKLTARTRDIETAVMSDMSYVCA